MIEISLSAVQVLVGKTGDAKNAIKFADPASGIVVGVAWEDEQWDQFVDALIATKTGIVPAGIDDLAKIRAGR